MLGFSIQKAPFTIAWPYTPSSDPKIGSLLSQQGLGDFEEIARRPSVSRSKTYGKRRATTLELKSASPQAMQQAPSL
jgi:hypothetical protein